MFSSQLRKTLYTKLIYTYTIPKRMQDLSMKRNTIATHIIFSQYTT